jgi:electron transfer flavoprotein-quinone oxidoreductase
MQTDRFDLIVVGAGPAGAAAALRAAGSGLDVAVLERGPAPGSKNVMGGVVYGHAVREALPDFSPAGAPVERIVTEQGYWLLTAEDALRLAFKSPGHAVPPENCFTVLRARWDPWFAERAEEAGAMLLSGTTVTGLIREGDAPDGRVVGVRTDRPDGDLLADAVIVAAGVHSLPELLASRPGGEIPPQAVALAVKEVVHLGEQLVSDRFGLKGLEGAAYELVGEFTGGLPGIGFLYTNRDTVSVGVGVVLADLAAAGVKPYDLLDRVKGHPVIGPYLAGGKPVEYSAHLIPEGGYDRIPRLVGDGWLAAGDAAGLVNSMRREGSNLAVMSGLFAADAVVNAKRRGDFSARTLGSYVEALKGSFVFQDLRRYRLAMPYLAAHREFFTLYPRLAAMVADSVFRTTGEARSVRAKRTLRRVLAAKSPWRALRDLYGLWRALNG